MCAGPQIMKILVFLQANFGSSVANSMFPKNLII